MAASTNRDLEAALGGEADGAHHILDAAALGDERRVPVVDAVPDLPQLVVAIVTGLHQPAVELRCDLLHRAHQYRALHMRPSWFDRKYHLPPSVARAHKCPGDSDCCQAERR